MRKEQANYKLASSIVVKRSPASSGRKSLVSSAFSPAKGISVSSSLRKSMTQNINSLNKVLRESEKIIPRTESAIIGNSKNA
ncbi:hypothetical protein [Cytobacillus firmus]|uniref:hypothetical protein n=1 Tax=Cytobacillus firmus TaxID=1399 RepID=UPI00300310D9